jgi:putative ABC transport system permease protein
VESDTRGPFAEASRIPGTTRESVARMAGVAAAGSITYQAAEAQRAGRNLRLYVVGYEPGRPGGPEMLSEGRPITRSHYELIADVRSGFVLGDRVRLGRADFTVVGITRGQVNNAGDPVVYMTLSDAQKLQFELAPAPARREARRRPHAPGTDTDIVNAVVARVPTPNSLDAVAESLRRWKHLTAMTQTDQENLLLESVVAKARKQIGLFTLILLAVSTVIIALIVYTMTLDKMREIATLKLIGAPDRTIVGMIVTQALAMGGIGFLSGAAMIVAVYERFPRRVVLQPDDGLLLGLVVLLVCLLASGLGVRLALRVDAAQALGG